MNQTMPSPNNHDRLKRLYLSQELQLAVNTIKSGLAILQRSRPYGTQQFLFLLVLSTGIERLMKLLLCLHAFDATGEFLSKKKLMDYGHDILALRDEICRTCFSKCSSLPPAIEKDRRFLADDALLNAILQVLGDFAQRDRYQFMDGINDPDSTGEWIDRRWEHIESMTMPKNEGLQLAITDRLDEFVGRATTSIVACVERFLRALARAVTHTCLGGDAKSMGTDVFEFLTIRDEDMGQREYSIINA